MVDLQIYPNFDTVAQAAAEYFIRVYEESLLLRDGFAFALSGGSTPLSLYRLLASDSYRTRIDWTRVHVFWGDERCVPPDHAESNYRRAAQVLLTPVGIPQENIHRVHAELPQQQAAAHYEEQLLVFFSRFGSTRGAQTEVGFDLALLGMGSDGHTASLFPGDMQSLVTPRWVVANPVARLNAWRISLTPALLNRSAQVLFLVTGAEKNDTLQRVLFGSHMPDRYPAQAIQPTRGQTIWMVDEDAASLL